ncbi:hypothetical protein [Thermovibrio guaymasensis]|uniref:hypothetical protein n=1 Tax=Thermovibrio guaymasensis TaxID=240167 RepID=UPI0014762144|nr:hypothetical protein [Thermovibrio guaymasensis]
MSMGELFREVLKELRIKRPVFEVPKFFLLPAALIGLFEFDIDQYRMIEDNLCKGEENG